jgi:hypothetical protein
MRLQQARIMTAAAFAAVLLAGCAGSDDRMASLLITPGKYALYKCPQLAVAIHDTAVRQRELEALMAKARTGAGGQLVDAAVYRPDYLVARGELNEMHREARAKHCTLPPDTAGAAAAPPPAKKPAAAPKPQALPPPPKRPPS